MKQFLFVVTICFSVVSLAQIPAAEYEKFPVFPECESVAVDALEDCFQFTLQQFIFNNFKVPEKVFSENYKGNVNVFFEVTRKGSLRCYIQMLSTRN